jgi:hypothetical protein
MDITRRGLLALIPGILLIPAVGLMAATPARSEALQWVLDHLEPGTLLSVRGPNLLHVMDFASEVCRAKPPSELVANYDGKLTPRDLKHEALRRNLPALNLSSRDPFWEVETERSSDIVVHIEDGQMWITKHRRAFTEDFRKPMRLS